VAAEIEAECPPKKAKTKETELNVTNSVPKAFTSNEGKLNMIMKSNDDLQKQVTSLNETIAAMQNQPSTIIEIQAILVIIDLINIQAVITIGEDLQLNALYVAKRAINI
jgi:hypothetical protein